MKNFEADEALLAPFRAYARALGREPKVGTNFLHLLRSDPRSCRDEERGDFPGPDVGETAFRARLLRGPNPDELIPCVFCAKNLREDDREAEDLARALCPRDEA